MIFKRKSKNSLGGANPIDKKKDGQRVFNVLVYSILLLAILFAFEPYMHFGEPKRYDIAQFDYKQIKISPEQLPLLLRSDAGKPSILLIYASWCGSCRQVMPYLKDMMINQELEGFKVVFLSVDDQPRSLSRYLVNGGYDDLFAPYRLFSPFNYQPFKDLNEKTGSNYPGSVPYIAFFNHEGRMITEISGAFEIGEMRAILKRIQDSGAS